MPQINAIKLLAQTDRLNVRSKPSGFALPVELTRVVFCPQVFLSYPNCANLRHASPSMNHLAFIQPSSKPTSSFLSSPPLTCPLPNPNRHRTPPVALAKASKKRKQNLSPTVINRPARFRYEFLETHECGVELLGTEIKSVRGGQINLRDGYARVTNGQIYLHNVHISPWNFATEFFNHDPLRVRRLLLHKREIRKLEGKQAESGLTIIPVKTYFSENGYLKVEIALAKGKKLHDRRETIKKREDARDMRRVIKATMSG